MQVDESATVKQWRQVLARAQQILSLDGRTREAKRWTAERQLLLATASDEELEQMATISVEVFPYSYEEVLKDLRNERERHRETVGSWRSHLGKFQK